MKLLQINDKEWINPDLIMTIEEDPVDNSFCFIQKICEEVYYGDDGICKEDK